MHSCWAKAQPTGLDAVGTQRSSFAHPTWIGRGFNHTLRNGAPGEIRTPDTLVRSQVLYPTELRALNVSRVKIVLRDGANAPPQDERI